MAALDAERVIVAGDRGLIARRDRSGAWAEEGPGDSFAVVEPVAAMIGAALVGVARPLLPYALSFAAGAMIFVVIEELIPESQGGSNTDLATASALVGFTVMMVLDLALG